MLEAGDRIPDVEVWVAPQERARLREIVAPGSALLFFYLFDWSST